MIQKGKPGSERLVTYYNKDLKGWYNGKERPSTKHNSEHDYKDGGGKAGIMLVGLALYGIYCAGTWLLGKKDETGEEEENSN